jgi:acyltransferase
LPTLSEAAAPTLPGAVSTAATTLAVGGMMVVLTHAAVLWALKTPGAGSVYHLVIALVAPWVAALIAARTPIAPWLVGTPMKVNDKPRGQSEGLILR